MDKKTGLSIKKLLIIPLIILLLPIAFAGWFDFLKGGLTGNAAHSVQLTIQDAFPNITMVSTINDVVITPAGVTGVLVWFVANDSNGVAAFKDSSASIILSKAGEVSRSNSSCVRESNLTAYSSNFSCYVDIYYYDAGSGWNVNVSINDTADNMDYDDTVSFNIQSYMELNLTTDAVSFASLAPNSKNQTPAAPINMTNIANQDIDNISITAYDLIGQTGLAVGWTINASEFRADNNSATVCGSGLPLLNDTAINVNISASRFNSGVSTSAINYCIPTVPMVGSGIYNTTNTWTITATG